MAASSKAEETVDSMRWFLGRPRNRLLQWWLAWNLVAMVFGFTHALLDAFLVIPPGVGVALALTATILIVIWWSAGLVVLVRSSTRSRLAIAGVWVGAAFAFLNGLSIVACPPPCGGSFGIGDAVHIGSLLSSVVAALLTWRFLKHRAAPGAPSPRTEGHPGTR